MYIAYPKRAQHATTNITINVYWVLTLEYLKSDIHFVILISTKLETSARKAGTQAAPDTKGIVDKTVAKIEFARIKGINIEEIRLEIGAASDTVPNKKT